MRPYATVSPLFWTGSTGKKLRKNADAQRVAFYLMTCPHSHQTGIYYLPMLYLVNEVGIVEKGASKALAWLSDEGFAKYDVTTEWVWVCEMASWQIGSGLSESDKRCKGVQQYLATIPALPFIGSFHARYAVDFHLGQPPEISPLQGAPEGASSEQSGSGTRSEQEQNRQDGALAPSPAKLSEEPKRRPSRRCPSDFPVTDEMRVWASTECPGVNVDQQTKAFRDYEFRNTHVDWEATWRTWMRKSHDNQRAKANGSAPSRAKAFPG